MYYPFSSKTTECKKNSYVSLKNILQPPINHTVACARLVTFVYVKFAQILVFKVVSNDSINVLQWYSSRIFFSPCYGWDMYNGSWGLCLVIFCHAHLKLPHVESYESAVLWHQNKATQCCHKITFDNRNILIRNYWCPKLYRYVSSVWSAWKQMASYLSKRSFFALGTDPSSFLFL